jgi:hypothetical protein
VASIKVTVDGQRGDYFFANELRVDPANSFAMVSAGWRSPWITTHIVRGLGLMPPCSLAEGNCPNDNTNSFCPLMKGVAAPGI